jgi:tRNA-modifying protein YgfZ
MMPPPFLLQALTNRSVVSVTGEGAEGWLDDLITCDISKLSAGQAAYGALLSPQGKIQSDLFVLKTDDRLLLDVPTSQLDMLMKRLAMYKLRAKVSLVPEPHLGVAVADVKPDSSLVYADPRHALLGWRAITERSTMPQGDGYDLQRIGLGLADFDRDMGFDKIFPHDVNFDQWGGVSFTKGCFVGQEVVSRMQHRGTARNRLLPVRVESLVPLASQQDIRCGDTLIGSVSSAVPGLALAMLRLDRLAEASAPLMAGDTRVHVNKPDWIRYDVRTGDGAL